MPYRTRTRSRPDVAVPVATFAWVALVAACAGDTDAPGNVNVVVRDSAGVAIVENRGAGWDSATAWRLSAEPLLVIGARSGDPAEELARVEAATRLSDGRIAVLEAQTNEVRYFDAAGRPLITVGGTGGGPGEFRYARTMLRLPGDSLLVEDRRSQKQVVFGPEGELAYERAVDGTLLRALDGAYACIYLALFPDRSRVACVADPSGSQRVTTASGLSHIGFGLARTYERFVWVDSALTSSDTLGRHGGLEQFGADVGGPIPDYVLHPFYSRTHVAATPDPPRFYIALNPEYSIEVWSPGGLEHIVRRIGARRAPDAELREAALSVARGLVEDQEWNRVQGQLVEPDSIPAVTGLAADPDGYLWVDRTLGLERVPHEHDVFDPEGRFLGTMRIPDNFRILEIGRDYILGAAYDEYNVPYIQLWGLERTVSAR